MNIEGKLAYITERQKRVDNWPEVIETIVARYGHELVDLNRAQLLYGRNTDEQLLTPTYLNDPYFKTKGEAQAYYRMKKDLEAAHKAEIKYRLNYPDKPSDTPNLIVNGVLVHHPMHIERVGDDEFMISISNPELENDLNRKYNNRVFGLTPLSKEFWWNHRLRQELYDYINFLKGYD